MKQLTAIFFTCYTALLFAQQDSVDLYTRNVKLMPGYLVVMPNEGTYRVEQYMLYKEYFYMERIHNFTAEKLAEETKHMSRKRVPVCDSMVNLLRNSVYLGKESAAIDSLARVKLGYSNEFSWFAIERVSKANLNQCALTYGEQVREEMKLIRKRVDSLYREKEEFYKKVLDGSFQFDIGGLMNYLQQGSWSEADYRIVEWLILNDTRKFLSAIEKMEDDKFFTFTLALNSFPPGSKIEEMQMALKAIDFGSKRKNKVIKRLRLKPF